LVRQHREQVAPVAGHLGEKSGLAAAAQQVAHLGDGQQLASLQPGAGPGRRGMAMAPAVIASSIST